jgi:EmrB/QacA subfamily drug resistance transporter
VGDTGSVAGVTSGAYPRRWAAAVVMIVAALLDLIDVTIVNVALPTVARDLKASSTQLEWVISAYALSFAAVLIIAGRLGDLWGRKKLFLVGVGMFGLASLSCSLARNPTELIASRALQGAFAATLTPQVLATFRSIFHGRERGSVFGLYGAIAGVASALGLLLGGLLVNANLFGLSWRTVFMINIPIAALVLVFGTILVPPTQEQGGRRPDVLGSVVLALGMVGIVFPLLEGRRYGWPLWGWLCLAAGVGCVVALGWLEARRRHGSIAPILTLRLFAVPAFTAGLLVQLAFSLALQGFFLALTIWLQNGQHYSPLRTGFVGTAFSVGVFLTAGLAPRLAPRYGRNVLMTGGLVLAAGITGVDLAAHHMGTHLNPWSVVPGLVVAGMGLGLLLVPLVNVVISAVSPAEAGNASGMFNTTQQLGGALGIAVIGTLFFGRADRPGLTSAFTLVLPVVAGTFVLCALLCLVLPKTAVTEIPD